MAARGFAPGYQLKDYNSIAVTYDGTSQTDNVKFYGGGRAPNGKVKLVKTLSLNQGPVTGVNTGLILGSQRRDLTPVLGLIDNARIFGTRNANDPRGALSLEELEWVRAFDLYRPGQFHKFLRKCSP
jgi:hypothetical protein